jgi:hypothetical protein
MNRDTRGESCEVNVGSDRPGESVDEKGDREAEERLVNGVRAESPKRFQTDQGPGNDDSDGDAQDELSQERHRVELVPSAQREHEKDEGKGEAVVQTALDVEQLTKARGHVFPR